MQLLKQLHANLANLEAGARQLEMQYQRQQGAIAYLKELIGQLEAEAQEVANNGKVIEQIPEKEKTV